MIFIEKINKLVYEYNNALCEVKDEAILYGVFEQKPPLAKHIVFNPMPDEVKKSLVENYKLNFPKQLLTLYSVFNGVNLFWRCLTIGEKNIKIPISCFSIYWVPLTYDRQHIEPFNISIEDLNIQNGTPTSWLKFGSYYKPNDLFNRFDLFIDTESEQVFAVKHGIDTCEVSEKWDSIDNCLCCIFDLLKNNTD